jgi:hypothetical protein
MYNTISILFWICLFLVFYTYIGYGIVLWVAVKVKELFSPRRVLELPETLPEVTLFITAYNEEEVVDEKMENRRETGGLPGRQRVVPARTERENSCD